MNLVPWLTLVRFLLSILEPSDDSCLDLFNDSVSDHDFLVESRLMPVFMSEIGEDISFKFMQLVSFSHSISESVSNDGFEFGPGFVNKEYDHFCQYEILEILLSLGLLLLLVKVLSLG